MSKTPLEEFTLSPDPANPRLSQSVDGVDHAGAPIQVPVVHERALTLFLNGQEIVTMMTIGDHPEMLAVGYLLNQNMLKNDDEITAVDYDEDLEVVVVRTARETDFRYRVGGD